MFSNYVIDNFVKVVYMDEPSTGLDPASRKNLWNVVNRAKQDRAIILTSTFFLSHDLKHILVVALHRFIKKGLTYT
jgi:ABC-type multidrug transport system ATPase subunit